MVSAHFLAPAEPPYGRSTNERAIESAVADDRLTGRPDGAYKKGQCDFATIGLSLRDLKTMPDLVPSCLEH